MIDMQIKRTTIIEVLRLRVILNTPAACHIFRLLITFYVRKD